MKTLSLLTYNILYSSALDNAIDLIKQYNPDVVCLQEISTEDLYAKKEEIETYGYALASSSNTFLSIRLGKMYGLATFYKTQSLTLVQHSSINLPRSIIEILLILLRGGRNYRTVLQTSFLHKKTHRPVHICNIHLTAFGINTERLYQLKKAFSQINIDTKDPLILAGDFNYPYKRSALERLISKFELKEATKNVAYTSIQCYLKLIRIRVKLDYIFYKNTEEKHTEKIFPCSSDHYPIISSFDI